MATGFPGLTASPFTASAAWPKIGDATANIRRAGLAPLEAQQQEPVQRTARVAYDPTQGKYFIGGFLVDENNDTDIATMAKFAGQEAPLPEGNWQTVDDASFAEYVQSIRSPDTLKLMAKNFGMGVDEMQQMAGYGLQWLGAEELGRGIVAQQERDLAPNQVYNRNFTDIGSSPENGVLDWMAATIGRLGPNIVESTISAAIGAGIGGAVSGPAAAAGAPIGAVAGFFGKTAVKKALLEAAKKQLKGETLEAAEKKLLISAAATSSAAKEALEKQAKKQALTAADEAAITSAASANALMDTTRAAGLSRLAPGAFGQYMDEALTGGAVATRDLVNRRARQVGGAAGASLASNTFQQTGAAYGETMADGSEGNRLTALAVGIPGALADTIPEFILAGRLFSELGGDVIGAAKKQKSAMDLLKGVASGRTGRVVKYAGAGAAIEGGTEGFQEVLQIAANPILDLGSPEASNRIVNALAAGALMGGVMGGGSGVFAGSLADNKQETNLLLPVSQSDPNYAQYRADLKAKLGEAEYKNIFGPPQPYTRIMEEEEAAARAATYPTRGEFEGAAQADLQAQRQAAMDAQRQAAQQFVSGMPGTAQPIPAERLLGLAPQGAPVTTDQQLRQEAAAFFGGQAPRAPVTIPSTPTPVVAQQQALQQQQVLQQQALQQAQQAAAATQAQQFFGGQQAAPIAIPPMAPPGTVAPLPIAPVIQQRGEAQAQAQEQARRAATDRIVTRRQRELARGRAQRFVAGPQRQPIAQTPMGAGMTTTFAVPPPAPLPQTGGTGPTFGMTGETTATMQQRLKKGGKKGGKTTVNVPTGTAASVETLSTGSVPELTPNITKASERIRTFVNELLLAGKTAFSEIDIAKYIFPKMGKVTKLLKLEKLSRKQKDQVQRFADTMVNKLRVAERSGIGKDGEEFNITRETVDAFNAGAGGASLRTLAEIPADRAAGEQPTAEPGAGGKAGTRNRGRNRKPTTGQEPASKTQGPAAGSEQAQAEADVPPAVEPRRQRKPLSESEKQTDLQQFLKTYADPKSFGGMRENKNLADVVEYADWLGSLSKAELAKIEPVFSKRDNPFLNAGNMDVARARAKLEEAISPKAPEGAAPSKEAAEPKLTDREVWEETFDDKGVGFDKLSDEGKAAWKKLIARKGGFTVVDAEQLQAQFAPKKTDKELASEAFAAAKALRELGLDSGKIPTPKNEVEELHFAIAKVQETSRVGGSNYYAALAYLARFLGSTTGADARRTAKAYVSQFIEDEDIAAAKARVKEEEAAALEAGAKAAEAEAVKAAADTKTARAEARAEAAAMRKRDKAAALALKNMEEESKQGRYMLSQFDLVENPIDESGRPAKGVNPIRVKAIVDKFRSGLAKAPQFYVYKNQADLQRRNPTLYQQAVGSRPQGDFDTARASGFAFDGKVIVFTDRIPTEKYMRLLLAHESIGHFGMRALLPASKFDALMDYVYENNMAVRSAVDSKLGVRPTGVAPMSRRGFLKGTSSVIGAAVVPKMPRIPAKLDVDTFITAYSELQDKLGNINNPDSVGKMGDLLLEILSPIKGERNAAGPRLKSGAYMASDYDQAVNKMDSILDNARRYVDDNMNRTLDNLEQRLEFGPDDDYLTYWFEENEAEAAPLLKQFSSLIEEAYQKRNVEIADHVRSTLDMVKNKLGGSAKTEARSSTSEDVDMLGARREAVEEYMAKYAEKLDSSVITRVWNAIKDVLNKLGIKFEDDIVRYLVSQARRTVREGSSMFTPSTFALNVHTITTNNGTGRFSQQSLYSAQHEISNAFHIADAPITPMEQVNQKFRDYRIDGADKLENFIRNVFRLRNFNALRNHGAKRFEDLKDAMRVAAQTLRNVYNEKLAGLLALSGESRHVVSYALIVSRRIADRRFMLDKELRNSGLIVLGDEQPDGTRALDVNKPIFERLLKMGTLSRDELNNGAEVTFEEPTEGGKYKKTTVKIPGVKDKLGRDLTQNEYNIYVKTRRDLAELDVERLKGQLQNFIATEEITTKGIRKVLADKNMTDADVSFVKSVVNHAKKLHLDDIEYDERGMPIATPKDAVRMEQYFAAINNAVVKREFTDDLKAEVRKFYLPKQGRDEDGNIKEPSAEALAEGNKKSEAAIKKIEEFRSRRTEFTGREEQSVVYTLQDRIKEIVLADAAFEKAQMSARRSIGSSHVPLWREGSWQVRVEAQINGETVKLHPEVQNKLLFSLHTQRSESENAAAVFNGEMKGLEYSGLVYNKENGEYTTQTFKLFAVPSKVVESVASEPSIDIDNFLYTLRVLGQPLTPDKHAKAITMLTAPGSALRKALRFDDTPGYDPLKSVEAIARHVTTRSSLIARTKFQPHMRDLMDLSTDTGKLWFGDKEAVMTAKENLDKATTDAAKAYWQDKLTTDLYKFITTNPGAKGWDGSRASFPNQPKQASLGMRDYSDSVKEMEWMQDSSNINESTFEGKQFASGMKMITSIAFLGGMFTQFAQNLMSPATNVMPYLASKDSQTGFGGGFGMAVMPTYLKAFKDVVGFRGLNPVSDPIKDAEAFENIANDIKAARDTKNTAKEAELTQQYGLSYYEALNIAREIREGKLIPAQANALLETARGIFTGPVSKGFLKFSDFYMSPFNVSEQATRRATFLTAFRLEFDRLVKAGFNEDKASEMARMFAVDTVDKTLGEYSNTNRPPVWRDGWQSLLFVYKTYPLTSLLLFKNLSRAGKIGMLTSLYVLAGAAGFPLVDDMEDFIDTLSQRLGLDLGQGPAVRMAIIRQLEEVFPGWSDMILRGPLNHYTGADVGAKFGLEDFIPGTGILLKGANTTEELKGIAGPVVGMGLSVGKFLYDAARAPLSSTVNVVDVLRESPFSLMRAGGDVAAYLQNGAIVDRRGYVVTPEVSAMTMAYRLMGFYPAEAAKQYDFIKYANRMNYDYKDVGMAYKLAWVKAKKTGDERQAARIVREVNDWNEANRGGPGMIRNFLKNAQRALKEANRPAGERFLKSAPVASRAEYDRFLEYITGE